MSPSVEKRRDRRTKAINSAVWEFRGIQQENSCCYQQERVAWRSLVLCQCGSSVAAKSILSTIVISSAAPPTDLTPTRDGHLAVPGSVPVNERFFSF
jgi:hypothetical protein